MERWSKDERQGVTGREGAKGGEWRSEEKEWEKVTKGEREEERQREKEACVCGREAGSRGGGTVRESARQT